MNDLTTLEHLLAGWWQEAREVARENRIQMAMDEDFYDGIQWTEEEISTLKARNQEPLVFNHIKPTIDWVLGTERKNRLDFKVLPRTADDVKAAQDKTSLLKYVQDVNGAEFARSQAFADAVRAGIGWLEDGATPDLTEDPIYSRAENWRNVWHDYLAQEWDLSDARFLFRRKWLDLTIAEQLWPQRTVLLRAAAQWPSTHRIAPDDDGTDPVGAAFGDAWSGTTNHDQASTQLVEVIEAWYREMAPGQRIRYLDEQQLMRDARYDADDVAHAQALERGTATLIKTLSWTMRYAFFVADEQGGGRVLETGESPYRHNQFPFTPIWCFRRKRDGMPYGMVRQLRDPQFDLNKRASKSLFILSTNRTIADANAVDDWESYEEEVAKPNAIIRKRSGAELTISTDTNLAESHVRLMERDALYIQQVSGVTSENLGRDTNAASGKAIVAKQTEGAATTFQVFDLYRQAYQAQGRKQLSLIEQYYSLPRRLRLVDTDTGAVDWLDLNRLELDELGQVQVLNDITATQADFVVSAAEYNATVRQMMAQQLLDTIGKMPGDISVQLLHLAVDMMDLPKKDEVVRTLRELTGQPDPAERDTPEGQAAQQQRAAAQAQEQALAQRRAEAQTRELEAKVDKLVAEAWARRVQTHQEALNAGQIAVALPQAALAGDQILRETQA